MAKEPKKIVDFLSELVGDPKELEKYFIDQETAVEHSELSPEKKDTLLSNDLKRIVDAITDEYGPEAIRVNVQVIMAPPKFVPQVILAQKSEQD